MKLRSLIKNIDFQKIKGNQDIAVTGVCSNSKFVSPGNIFIARKGLNFDGSLFIQEAMDAGAIAIVTDLYNPLIPHVTQLIHQNPKKVEILLADRYYHHPSSELFMVGVTGTNGKTTTSYLIKYLLDQLKGSTGLIGTIEYVVGNHHYQAVRTTPDVIVNQKLLKEMVSLGSKSCIMEVTSHALEQERVSLIDFDVAVFTNLTHEHLDYHKTMENYALAKQKLFLSLPSSSKKRNTKTHAIVNADSPWHQEMIKGCMAPVLTYGIQKHADLKATITHLSPFGTEFEISYLGKKMKVKWPLVGDYNLSNGLAALATVLSQGFSLEKSLSHLPFIPAVPGRLQKVSNLLNLAIFVDYAHTPDALENVLICLQKVKKGKIIVVFGCGGERDTQKRPVMAKTAEKFSDFVFVTNDNPRGEDPEKIVEEIAKGFSSTSFEIELNRNQAIRKAIQLADHEDIILIAGKGHENMQIFAHHTVEFNDASVAQKICEELSFAENQPPF